MRNQFNWAEKHRNGFARARKIIDRQDRKKVISLSSKSIIYRSQRECDRRKIQIEMGQLKIENRLIR